MRGTYTGETIDGIRHGQGVLVFVNGDRYEGSFVQGFRQGKGVFISERGNRVYEGEWKRSEKHGVGKEKWLKSGDRYEGEYQKDVFHGKGLLIKGAGKTKYEGEFRDGQKDGHGRMEFAQSRCNRSTKTDFKTILTMESVSVYDGSWKDGRIHGAGKYTRADGDFYEGTWVEGLRHGFGKEVLVHKGEIYEGTWCKGVRHGEGSIIRDGRRRNGVWDMGQRIKWTTAEVTISKK